MYTISFTNEPLKDNRALAEANAAARTAQKLGPNDPKVLASLANTLLWTGQPQEALPVAARVPQVSPSYAEGLAYCGDILIHNGYPAEVIPHLKKGDSSYSECSTTRNVQRYVE
jgi:predicted Zn-dependent protease